MKLTGSRLRQIIKEEIQRESLRVSTQRERMPVAPKIMPYSVPVQQHKDWKVEVERAIEAAFERAANDYPEIEWEVDVGPSGGPHVVPRRTPRDQWDTASYVVYLKNLGPAEDFSRVPGGDQFAQSMEDYGDMDIDLDR